MKGLRFENKMLRKTFRLKKEKGAGYLRKLLIKDLCSSPNTIRMIKPRSINERSMWLYAREEKYVEAFGGKT
jgi:hypothetical protein